MARVHVPIAFTRIDRWLTGAIVVAVVTVATLVWLSQSMVAPSRPRISESKRPTIGLAVRSDGPRIRVARAAGPSREAGLRTGDAIVAVDGLAVPIPAVIDDVLRTKSAGQSVHVEARRKSADDQEEAVLAEVKVAERDISPADIGLPFEDVSFRNADGLTLRGWYLPPPSEGGGRAPAIAYGHGSESDRRQWLPVALAVHEAGFAQILFDFTGRGESDGEVITLGAHEHADLRSALDVLTARAEVDPLRLGIAGRDMGAVAAIELAAGDARVKAVVLDSAYADVAILADHMVAAHHLPAGLIRPILFRVSGWRAHYNPASVQPVEAIRKVKVPVLLFHGDHDTLVPYQHAQALRDAAGGPFELDPLPGLDHDSPRPGDYADRIARFLTRTISASGRTP